jgi:arylsulfatase A-like enzyme
MPARRDRAGLAAVAFAAAFSGCAPVPPSPRTASDRPNVLFIAVDDLRPELGAYGVEEARTPNIDRLAAGGFVFTRAYVQQAVCNPSRASLMTGLRPDSLRVWDLATRFRDSVPDVVTLPQHFIAHGYHAVAIGKVYHNVIPDPASWSEPKLRVEGYPFDPDAVYRGEESVGIQEARKAQILAAGRQDRHIDEYGQWYLKANATESVEGPDDLYYDGAQAGMAVAKLAKLRELGTPFFFAVGFYRPHLPFNAPKRYWDLFDRETLPLARNPRLPEGAPPMSINNMRELRGYADFRHVVPPAEGRLTEAEARLLKHGYYASVSYVDAQVGRLLDALDDLGLAENTIVVLWGDHGWKLGEHNAWAKMTNYEIDTRAPLILRVPPGSPVRGRPRAPGGTRIEGLVEFVDIYPTLSELAGLPVPGHLQGVSAVPLLSDPSRPWKRAAFHQFLREGIWAAPDGVPYMGYAVRTERYRYVRWMNWESRSWVARELYDLEADPLETVNVADRPESASVVAELERLRAGGWRRALPAP